MTRSTASLFLLHLVGNALVLWLGYYWLGIGESDDAHLLWSALVILTFVCSGLWLHGAGFAFFNQGASLNFRSAIRRALRHLLPLLVLSLMAFMIYGFLAYWHDAFGHNAFVIGSYATMKLRKPVKPSAVLRAFYVLIWLLRWLIVPMLLLPIGANVAVSGWSGFRVNPLRRSRPLLYWIEVCVLLLCAIWVPLRLIEWVPQVSQFGVQMASFAVRLGCGYLLFVGALLVLEFVTSSGKPRFSHVKTVPSP